MVSTDNNPFALLVTAVVLRDKVVVVHVVFVMAVVLSKLIYSDVSKMFNASVDNCSSVVLSEV